MGGTLRVERELQTRGRLRVAEGGAPFEGSRQGNLPLDCVSVDHALSDVLYRRHAVESLSLAIHSGVLGQVQSVPCEEDVPSSTGQLCADDTTSVVALYRVTRSPSIAPPPWRVMFASAL